MSDKKEQREQKRREQEQKVREQIAALVEPGETLRHAVVVTKGIYALALGPLGVAFLRFRNVALTDKGLYVMVAPWGGGGPKEVKQRIPLPVAVSVRDNPWPRQNWFVVGDQKFWLGSPFKEEAESIAVAASAPAAASAP